jgi:hypothetical protein
MGGKKKLAVSAISVASNRRYTVTPCQPIRHERWCGQSPETAGLRVAAPFGRRCAQARIRWNAHKEM